ncbi:unnamed protein product [Caenorhabditis sp. 36 PRJEB53466]|nr:unnamed protein product [Caenorhabditis sp. 36 PRJEB53466]
MGFLLCSFKLVRSLFVVLVFAVSLPFLAVYGVYKKCHEQNVKSSRKAAISRFRARRAADFLDFENKTNPSNLVHNERILGASISADVIENTMKTILTLDFQELREALQDGRYNASIVVSAYIWRAIKINKKLNCITEVISSAITRAAQLDDEYRDRKKPPFFGLPFSVKSNFHIENYDATVGLAQFLDRREHSTCALVQFLSDQGAVPFCLTNVPQGLLSYVSSNPIYGRTINPWDFDRTPGGSSGGEAALVAAGGAAFGIGNDLVGSLRIPAAFCGLVTVKPTQDRLHESGMNPGHPGRGRLGLSTGFYTRTVTDQEWLLREVIGNPKFTELCPSSSSAPLGSTDELPEGRKPSIGWFVDDGFGPVAPSNRRAVMETIEKLKKKGYETVEFKVRDVDQSPEFSSFAIADMLFRNVMPDNGEYMSKMYSGEEYEKDMKDFIVLIRYKQCFLVRWLAQYVLLPLSRLEDIRQNQENTDDFKRNWIKYWKEKKIDALICPSFITPAQPFAYPARLSTGVFITGLFNMLDVPAGIVPVGPVLNKENEEGIETHNDYLLEQQKKAIRGTEGLPNAVQVVALPNCEEMCLRVMRIVEGIADGADNKVKRLRWKLDGNGTDTVFEAGGSEHCFEWVDLRP